MKQKKQNRILAALLAVAMMFQMLPLMVFADDGAASSDVKIEGKEGTYTSLKEAVEKAESGDTILLGEGKYSLYGIPSTGMTRDKDLTFVGQGTDKTVWAIGADVPDPNKTGEYNGDYSFDGAGTVTFKNMTLRPGNATDPNTKLGFIRPDNTVVDNCEIVGWTVYWGYKSAEFKNTTFKPSLLKDAIWVYSSPVATFNNCKFTAGRGVKVYTEDSTKSVTVNFNDCTVENSDSYPAIYIDEYVLERDGSTQRYNINITGSNNVTAQTNTYTCSKLFGFKRRDKDPGYFTNVKIDGKLVWSEGKMLTHDYTDGQNEPNLTTTPAAWTEKGSHYEREVTTTCNYCGYTTKGVETGYKLAYDLNGGVAAAGADYTEKIVAENETVKLAAAPAPAQEGVYFLGWEDESGKQYNADATITLTANTKLTAQWGDVPPVVPDTPDGGSGGEIAGVIVAAGTAVIGYYAGTGLLMHHYGLPYWRKNRSELALMLWEDADRPMPESALLYPDVGQKEEDMDLQHAARWAMEHDLMPDLNDQDTELPPEQVKFYPDNMVTKISVLRAWKKAQDLKQNAQ